MRRCVGVFVLCTFLLVFGTSAKAADVSGTWVSGNTGNWSNTANWSAYPEGTGTATIGNGTVTLDSTQSCGIVLMNSGTAGTATLNITSGANLTVSKASTEIFGVSRLAGGTGTVNHSGGTVRIYHPSAATGELRLANIAGALGAYNLSGTAVLDVQVLNKGAKDRSVAFNATGGTLVVRGLINKFGLISENAAYGFDQGDATLEVGAIDTVAAITFGNATNLMDYKVNSGGALNIDIASASSYDTIVQYGSVADTLGAAISIGLLAGFTPDAGSFFDVWTFSDKTKAGSGAVTGLSSSWAAAWVDTNADLSTDTLRLTYIPEPATIGLLGLGLLAIRRNKK